MIFLLLTGVVFRCISDECEFHPKNLCLKADQRNNLNHTHPLLEMQNSHYQQLGNLLHEFAETFSHPY